jgi:hypothetical protein
MELTIALLFQMAMLLSGWMKLSRDLRSWSLTSLQAKGRLNWEMPEKYHSMEKGTYRASKLDAKAIDSSE